MSIDSRFLGFLADELHTELLTGRIQKISQLGKYDFLFFVRVNNQNKKLYLSLSTSLARINLTDRNYPSDYMPGGFCMFLRKYLEGGFIEAIQALNHDRIMEIKVNAKNEIGDQSTLYLVLEFFSRYSNMIILDDSRQIINAFKHISPFEGTDRIIVNGYDYSLPEDDRILPDDMEKISVFLQKERTYKELVEQVKGMSPLLANYIVEKGKHNPSSVLETYKSIMNQELNPTMYLGSKPDFYHIDIFPNQTQNYNSLSELLDAYFMEASSLERVKQIHKYLLSFVKREFKRKKTKLEKLTKDLQDALEHDIWRIKGDLLLSNQHQINRGDGTFTGYSYELEQDLEVELDRLLNPIQNANKYYTKYKKQKTAVGYIEEQMSITKEQIEYMASLITQITETHDLNDLLEIQDELVDNKFLPQKKSSKKKSKPNYSTYYDTDGIMIVVGKNNIQNNYLTHRFAKKDYWWFHVQNQTGSHVIVCSETDLSETTIRTAAMLASYHSKSRQSGSVPVDYTRIRNIKRVPGNLGSFVTFTNQKTIYIDPDEGFVLNLKQKK